MRFKVLIVALLSSSKALAFVHISQLKPRLPISPEQPTITFYWNGDAPSLSDKEAVLEGTMADASDQDVMAALLARAMNTWSNVPTAYVILKVQENAAAHLDENDEVFSIVVDEQESKAVAAAALPNFISRDPEPSENERNPHLIHDCDITVSSTKVSAKSLLRTLVHELGHCLGLGHPHSSYRSIMSYALLNESTELSLDDKAGVSFLYPEPGESEKVQYLTSCGTLGGVGSPAGLWFGLPLLLYGWRLAYRRKI